MTISLLDLDVKLRRLSDVFTSTCSCSSHVLSSRSQLSHEDLVRGTASVLEGAEMESDPGIRLCGHHQGKVFEPIDPS